MTFTVESRDYDNKPVNAHVHLELLRWNYRGQKREPVGGATDVDTGSNGSATATLDAPARGGSYQAHVTAQTPEGRTVEDYSYFYISGGGLTDFGPANNRNLQIVPDKKDYRRGRYRAPDDRGRQAEHAGLYHRRRPRSPPVSNRPLAGFHRLLRHSHHRR